jgi:hypothetical protein
VVLDDVLGLHALLAQAVEVLHQVADREVGRVALAAVAELAPVLERVVVGHVERAHLVADAAQRGLDEQVVGHGQARHQERRVGALGRGELARHLVEPLLGGLGRQAQAGALLGLELRELGLDALQRGRRGQAVMWA